MPTQVLRRVVKQHHARRRRPQGLRLRKVGRLRPGGARRAFRTRQSIMRAAFLVFSLDCESAT
jgi:hypothetical protein